MWEVAEGSTLARPDLVAASLGRHHALAWEAKHAFCQQRDVSSLQCQFLLPGGQHSQCAQRRPVYQHAAGHDSERSKPSPQNQQSLSR